VEKRALADAAFGCAGDDHAVTLADAVHVLPHLLDLACCRMSEDGGRLRSYMAGRREPVGDADGGRPDANDYLVRSRRKELDLLDDQRPAELLENRGPHAQRRDWE
jgi:hypothetical protein